MRAGDGSGLGQSRASTHQRGGRRGMVGRLERWNVADSVSGKRAEQLEDLELRDISDRKLRKVLRDLDAQVEAIKE